MLVQVERPHSLPQVLEALVRGFGDVLLCEGPDSRIGAADDTLEAIKAIPPSLALNGHVTEGKVSADPQLLRLGLADLLLCLNLHLALQSLIIRIETGETRTRSCSDTRFSLYGLGAGRPLPRSSGLGHWLRPVGNDGLCDIGDISEDCLVCLYVLQPFALEGGDASGLLLDSHDDDDISEIPKMENARFEL